MSNHGEICEQLDVDTLALARGCLNYAEQIVIGVPLPWGIPLLRELIGSVVGVLFFWMTGLATAFTKLGVGTLMTGLAFMGLYWFGPMHGSSAASQDIYVALVLGFGLVLFGLPSRANTDGLRSGQTRAIAKFLMVQAPTADRLKILKSGVDLTRTRGVDRAGQFKWAMGIGWAALAWFATNQILATDLTVPQRSAGTTWGLGCFVLFLVIGLLGSSYTSAWRLLMQTVDFAFLDAEQLVRLKEEGARSGATPDAQVLREACLDLRTS